MSRVINAPNHNAFDSLNVRRFRGFSDLTLEGLGSFNLLVGANDCGKTSLLEALLLLAGYSNPRLPIAIQNNRGVVVQDFHDLSSLFHGLNVLDPVEMSAVSTSLGVTRRLSMRAKEFAAHERKESSSSSKVADSCAPLGLQYAATMHRRGRSESSQYRAQLRVGSADKIEIDEVETFDEDSDMVVSAQMVRYGDEYDARTISRVVASHKKNELLKFLKTLAPEISGISSRGEKVLVDTGLEEMIPLNLLGSGIVRAANLLSISVLAESRILLIDELENSLYHKGIEPLLRALLNLSMSKRVQVFATTQSLAVLQGMSTVLNDEAFEEVQTLVKIFSLAKDKNGQVRGYGFDHSQFDHCLQNGIEIR